MKKYLATVKDQTGRKQNLAIEASNRDDAMKKIPLRFHLVDLKEIPGQ